MYTDHEIEILFPELIIRFKKEPSLYLNSYLRLSLGAKMLNPQRLRFEGNLYRPVKALDSIDVTRRSKWGNPYKVEDHGLERALILFESDLLANKLTFTLEEVRRDLVGRNLVCWCKLDQPCHADILITYANKLH